MPDGFDVTTSALDGMADAIRSAAADTSTAGLSGIAAEAVGHAGLSIAVADFADAWGRASRQMSADAERFSYELVQAAEAYRNDDQAAGRLLSGPTD
ncbi:type VII secretion target [Pseudonocardia sp. ICBG1142]|uniref:type VII secretion target n=1 Tax=Pseudonocardia sp. ICBG1142 TaxID=2846760 RepID=UPI001CF6063F|nr:type VII secretion target [Pseudonocardia sp. ICBG1142]